MIEFSCEAIWSWDFVFWEISFITASISVLVIGLFIIYISSWFSLGRLNFTKNLSISSRLSVLLPYSSSYVSYNPLYMCIVCCNFSFFISNFVDLIPLPFFLDESVHTFVNFVYLLKEPAFSFINLYYFFNLFFIYFCSDLYYFFSSTNFGIFLFFFQLF